MKVVIAGASGFIGYRLTQLFLKANIEVVALLRSPKKISDLDGSNLKALAWDISSTSFEDKLIKTIEDANIFINCCIYKARDNKEFSDATDTFLTNCAGLTNIFNLILEAKIKRFVSFSSANSYQVEKGKKATEEFPLYPSIYSSTYLTSVVAAEMLAVNYCNQNKIAYSIFRIPSIYGISHAPLDLISRFISQLTKGKSITVANAGLFESNYLIIDDLVTAIIKANETGVSKVFNLASSKKFVLRDIVELIQKRLKVDSSLINILEKDECAIQPHFPDVDYSLAKNELNFKPTSLEEGIDKIVSHYYKE